MFPAKFASLRRWWNEPSAFRRPGLGPVRLYVYLGCTVLALLISYRLGKDMQWDTLDYHFYAGFSALHDRFRQDYFPAGSQSYFNPYAYVPFYLLARSVLPALAVASILAAIQSIILWLTYELALEVAPSGKGPGRTIMALVAVALALANPILIDQLGSSYADVTTGEMVLAGWLLLARAIRAPAFGPVILAGILLGAASALKLTNSVHAVSACVLLLFFRESWRERFRSGVGFGLTLALSFVVVCAPWSMHLERHFGNPLFPLLNNIFHSPQYPVAPAMDYRFIPDSFAEALWRPFAIAVPVYMVDDEFQSPDLRYAVLLLVAVLFALQWLSIRWRAGVGRISSAGNDAGGNRVVAALGCAFLLDWILWLRAAANGRYFIPLACVAAVIATAILFRLFPGRPKLRNYIAAAILGAQGLQLWLGASYRDHVPWDGGPWFEVRMPKSLTREPALYLSYGVQSNAFIVPFLDPRSAFINVGGDYPLGPGGANGADVAERIKRYGSRIRVVARVVRLRDANSPVVSDLAAADNALAPFQLRVDASACSGIVVPDEGHTIRVFVGSMPPRAGKGVPSSGVGSFHNAALSNTGYLATCGVVPHVDSDPKRAASEGQAALALDRLEDACPRVFQPSRPLTQYFGQNKYHGDVWGRRYLNTSLTAWVSEGWVAFIDPLRGGPATYIGRVSDLQRNPPLHITCGRRDERYYAKIVSELH